MLVRAVPDQNGASVPTTQKVRGRLVVLVQPRTEMKNLLTTESFFSSAPHNARVASVERECVHPNGDDQERQSSLGHAAQKVVP